ncbi:sialidase family protein [Pelagicoccus sp. SDUM812002]|uniref:sialidase family protein n=1 Tax=Pelagicoccus sp. SDUM812002 TaxID=3041266 RepID=UPI00280F52ED|nr:sialidase family protein [Pelagicoccus sp. SDUM812002]MDQ8188411.1 sialidase family protein [Pelagicoccus sp. SDUM812002]
MPKLKLLLATAFLSAPTLPCSWADTDATILKHISIYEKRDAYCAWPAIARAGNDDIIVLFTRTEEHMSPNGEVLLSRSTDNGQTWLPPAIVYDTPIDDRESGLTTLADGRLLTHLRSVRFGASTYQDLPDTAYPPELIARWSDYVEKTEYKTATHLSRAWQTVSDDNGISWSTPAPGVDSIHGGIELQNGSLLVASYRDDAGNIGVHATSDPETPWQKIATVDCPRPATIRFGEPHILQLASGRIIMMIRATAKPYDDASPLCHLWASYSDDNGATWAPAYETPLWGFPPHLLQLDDGRILCSYGYRRDPFGQRACLSEDGITWKQSDEVVLRSDAANKDLGYPVSIELDPGRILTVYYQPNIPAGSNPATHPPDPNRKKPGILGTIWELPTGYD